MKLSHNIRQMLSGKCGRELNSAACCQVLALDIESCTGEHIGLNTLKRLLGFISDERQPRTSTLNIIATYLGYDNWTALSLIDSEKGNSTFNDDTVQVEAAALHEGDRVEVTYHPARQVIMRYKGNGTFLVQESAGSKLLAGDIVTLSHIVKGYPLLVSQVVRGGENLGHFTAGKSQGVDFKILSRDGKL